jgi:hypothetical protein
VEAPIYPWSGIEWRIKVPQTTLQSSLSENTSGRDIGKEAPPDNWSKGENRSEYAETSASVRKAERLQVRLVLRGREASGPV